MAERPEVVGGALMPGVKMAAGVAMATENALTVDDGGAPGEL